MKNFRQAACLLLILLFAALFCGSCVSDPVPSSADIERALEFNHSGLTAFNNSEYDQAIEFFSQAIDLNPGASVYSNRGIAYEMKGKMDLAIADYEAALYLDPNHAN